MQIINLWKILLIVFLLTVTHLSAQDVNNVSLIYFLLKWSTKLLDRLEGE